MITKNSFGSRYVNKIMIINITGQYFIFSLRAHKIKLFRPYERTESFMSSFFHFIIDGAGVLKSCYP